MDLGSNFIGLLNFLLHSMQLRFEVLYGLDLLRNRCLVILLPLPVLFDLRLAPPLLGGDFH